MSYHDNNQNFLADDLDNIDVEKRKDHVFFNNPVFIQGMGLATLIVPATSLKNALIIAIMLALILTPTRIIAALLSRIISFKFKVVIYTLTASAIYIPAFYLISWLFDTQSLAPVGLYTTLLVIEPLIIKKHSTQSQELVSAAFIKGVQTTIGYIAILFLVAIIREILGNGTIYGTRIFEEPFLPILLTPVGGFILLGLMAAFWKGLTITAYKNTKKGIKWQR